MMNSSEIPTATRIEFNFTDPSVSFLSIMCNGSLFKISASQNTLRCSPFEKQHAELAVKLSGPMDDASKERQKAMQEWILKPCVPLFQQLAPRPHKELTLQAYSFPPTYYLQLIPSGFKLIAKHVRNRNPSKPDRQMISSEELPLNLAVPHTSATELQIVVGDNGYVIDAPERVQIGGVGPVLFFKPISCDTDALLREVDSALSIRKAGLNGKIRVPEFHSLAMSKDGKIVLGLLFAYIRSPSNGHRLDSYSHLEQYHEKWEKQVSSVIDTLHKNNIVWGDPHPGNILIDENFDAWVADFGGGFVPEFVDAENEDTMEGDLQGIERIFKVWIKENYTDL